MQCTFLSYSNCDVIQIHSRASLATLAVFIDAENTTVEAAATFGNSVRFRDLSALISDRLIILADTFRIGAAAKPRLKPYQFSRKLRADIALGFGF